MNNQGGESGGAADQNLRDYDDVAVANEERGSYHVDEKKRYAATAHLAKRTKIPLAGLQARSSGKETFQIVVREVGADKYRFGSVSFSLRRFSRAAAQTYMHWVTLYDSLDDDLFEGTLGIDDDFDCPKILIEYSIVSSKYTSMINAAEKI